VSVRAADEHDCGEHGQAACQNSPRRGGESALRSAKSATAPNLIRKRTLTPPPYSFSTTSHRPLSGSGVTANPSFRAMLSIATLSASTSPAISFVPRLRQ
jgi:hypothetical protein